MNKYNNNNELDYHNSSYANKFFPDLQDKEVSSYSTCAGCGEEVNLSDVAEGEILDIYGMCVHDDCQCIKNAVQARVVTLDEIVNGE
ncbi:hypothetical protein [Paenibacillus tianjinensis]|uniref:GapA-binding peptide SR1P n=1 Tax=Paenibacillus tianjinensis TaxID=2810347 RepID=A0ABX7L9F8_9BACL|nr:hypothetical protein [Paenibacillus tianjinensis]QSF43349.1 hypothetical protein JRJ22_18970 [Paenibacillus tianjinensis]